MQYISSYSSPLGEIVLAADEAGLTGLWFAGQKYFASTLDQSSCRMDLPVFIQIRNWLDTYFSGCKPDFLPSLHPAGTPFQKQVWTILQTIPYGQTITYGQIAQQLANRSGKPQSPQAVGGAVGRNPISILIPCHRVIGADGTLTGYAGGLDRKQALLQLEGIMLPPSTISKKITKE
ncbi:MAG: methylated-DNA--[protein]-cysteine S-methyltransferase [Ruminococcaceae bacterium]|nr:methylated-DNA--[protein]-cysteine S-methyltransferase [Oscillospiraceae bacterium]